MLGFSGWLFCLLDICKVVCWEFWVVATALPGGCWAVAIGLFCVFVGFEVGCKGLIRCLLQWSR